SGEIGEDHDPETHLIPLVLQVALGQRENISIFGTDYDTPDGTCIRDYIHVTDLANAHLCALDHLRSGGLSDIFNCGYSKGYSVREVIAAVKRASGADFTVEEVARRAGDPAAIVAASAKIRDTLGWQPEHDDLDDIVSQALAWEEKLSQLKMAS
ncbi:MAG: NAD-dependent epimerase/dehydratase family protein, partial [Pseudomonadota bacterium]